MMYFIRKISGSMSCIPITSLMVELSVFHHKPQNYQNLIFLLRYLELIYQNLVFGFQNSVDRCRVLNVLGVDRRNVNKPFLVRQKILGETLGENIFFLIRPLGIENIYILYIFLQVILTQWIWFSMRFSAFATHSSIFFTLSSLRNGTSICLSLLAAATHVILKLYTNTCQSFSNS